MREERECENCHDHLVEPGQPLCADCQSDNEAKQLRREEEHADYRGPRYWRSL